MTTPAKVSAWGAEGVSDEENLAEIQRFQWSAKDIEKVTRKKRLGAHSGAERCKPGAKSRINKKKKGERLGAYSVAARREPSAKPCRNLEIVMTC